MTVGRNDTCPCGSGKKFKKCHGKPESATTPSEDSPSNPLQELNSELIERMLKFSKSRVGSKWMVSALDEFVGDPDDEVQDSELQFAIPWAMFDYRLPEYGMSIAGLFAREKGARLPADLRELLDAYLNSWISIWDVKEVRKGVGAQLTDLLTGEERFVEDVSGTEFLPARSVVLARVVDFAGSPFLGGVHPIPLPPHYADEIVRATRKVCRVRTRPVERLKLQNPEVQLVMIQDWLDISDELLHRPRPALTNTDGDVLSPTTDLFPISESNRASIVALLASFPGAEEPVPDRGDREVLSIVVTKPGNSRMKWDNTIIGRILVGKTSVRVESNSVKRADALKGALVSHLGQLVKHSLRQEMSQKEMWRLAESNESPETENETSEMTAEIAKKLMAFKEQHYAAWPDMEIPMLDGLTPREAAKRPGSRAKLEVLLRDLEMSEGRLPADERFDMSKLREKLGMTD
ncbi:MAG: YecA family protein [Thermoanaerobaculia bacterium]